MTHAGCNREPPLGAYFGVTGAFIYYAILAVPYIMMLSSCNMLEELGGIYNTFAERMPFSVMGAAIPENIKLRSY